MIIYETSRVEDIDEIHETACTHYLTYEFVYKLVVASCWETEIRSQKIINDHLGRKLISIMNLAVRLN